MKRKNKVRYETMLVYDTARSYMAEMPVDELLGHLDHRSRFQTDRTKYMVIGYAAMAVAGFVISLPFIQFVLGYTVQQSFGFAGGVGAGVGFAGLLLGVLISPGAIWVVQKDNDDVDDLVTIESWVHPKLVQDEWIYVDEEGETVDADHEGATPVPQVHRASSLEEDLRGQDYKNELKGNDSSLQSKLEIGMIGGILLALAGILFLFVQSTGSG